MKGKLKRMLIYLLIAFMVLLLIMFLVSKFMFIFIKICYGIIVFGIAVLILWRAAALIKKKLKR